MEYWDSTLSPEQVVNTTNEILIPECLAMNIHKLKEAIMERLIAGAITQLPQYLPA